MPDINALIQAMAAQQTPPITPEQQLQSQLVQSSQEGQQAVAEQLRRMRTVGDRTSGMIAQEGQIPIPKMGWSPQVGQGQGILHNILNSLAIAGLSTGPGRAVEGAVFGPRIKEYEAQRGDLAQRIEQQQKQQQLEEQPIGAAAGMVYHPVMAAASTARASAAEENAATNRRRADISAQRVQQQYAVELQRLQQGSQRLSIAEQGLKLREWFDKAVTGIAQARIQENMDVNEARIQANEEARAVMQSNQWALQHPIWNALGMKPNLESGQAARPPKPISAPAGSSGKRRVIDLTK